jgi:Winged helix DNA-binding domain
MPSIGVQRLHNQQLEQTTLQTPGDVVAWLGAVQAQDYAGAKWALGLRLPEVSEAAVERAFAEGSILRTHVMRPTWHFVTPADIRWLLALTAPRVNVVNGHMYRQLELDDKLFRRGTDALTKALQGGKHLTRTELGRALEQGGIVATGMRLGYIVHRAELDAVVCSGPRRGKQFTYALLDERAPNARVLSRDEALVELTRRYFTSHGPATVTDFSWWSGLTKAEVRAGLEMAKPYLVQEAIDGKTYCYAPFKRAIETSSPTAFLLPPYDEYTIAYKDHSAILEPMHLDMAKSAIYGGVIVIDTQLVGNWKRTFSKGLVLIELAPYRPLTSAELQAVAVASERFGEFLEMPVVLEQP